jgi:ATP-binding cassette subfamily B protein
MITEFHGKTISLTELRNRCYIDKEGVSLKGISEAAESIGFRTLGVKIPFEDKDSYAFTICAPLPLIAHWNQNHFVSVYKISKKYVWLADPGLGKIKLNHREFKQTLGK